MEIKWHSVIVVFSFILVLVVGTFIYHNVEGWSYLDSTYFMVITATTIGYGDFAPQTDIGKITTIFYSFIGIAFMFYMIDIIILSLISRRIKDDKAKPKSLSNGRRLRKFKKR
jgi:voltage-gated potassium channel